MGKLRPGHLLETIEHAINVLTKSSFFSAWIKVAGICGVATILALGLFSLFSILHVAMQLQRKEIWISFKRDVFAKLVTASLAGNFILKHEKFVFTNDIKVSW